MSLPNCAIVPAMNEHHKLLIFDGGSYSLRTPKESDKYKYEKYIYLPASCVLSDKPSEDVTYTGYLEDFLGHPLVISKETDTEFEEKQIDIDTIEYKSSLTYYQMLQCFYKGKNDKSSFEYQVCRKFIDIIKGDRDPAQKILFECPPTRYSDVQGDIFKFIIKTDKSEVLENDPTTFKDKYEDRNWDIGEGLFQRFPGLGGEKEGLQLIPIPREETLAVNSSNIRLFFKNMSEDILLEFLHCLAFSVLRRLSEYHREYLWVSTSGFGFAWLHARLYSKPKYYKHIPYKVTFNWYV